jgi:hypothetical protein
MAAVMEVLGGMPVLRIIAAADMAANQAHTQVHPGITGFQAIFTALCTGRNILDLVQMGALVLLDLAVPHHLANSIPQMHIPLLIRLHGFSLDLRKECQIL